MTSFRPDYGRFLGTALLAATVVAAPSLFGSEVSAASFDCEQQDLAADERAICEDRLLNDADVKMVTTFDLLSGLLAMGARGSMQDAQIAWLTKRQAPRPLGEEAPAATTMDQVISISISPRAMA